MPTDERPNIIWVMCDQMRWDAAGFMGSPYVRTPNLDRIAEHGVVFENAYCASPVCSPARASWLTGLYPHAHTQLRNYGPRRGRTYGSHLPTDTVTIGDHLKDAGYRCGLVGPWHLGDDHQPQHGFDFWRPYRYLGPDHPDPLYEHFESEGIDNIYTNPEGSTQHGNTLEFVTTSDPRQQRTTWTVDRSLDFLDEPHDGPFFLFVSVKDPHPLIAVPPECLEHYTIDDMPVPETLRDSFEGKPAYHQHGKFRIPAYVTDRQIQEMTAYYFALITHIDTQVGRLIEALDRLDQLDNTILIFMSDHGELLGDHGYTEKCFLYEASIRVPMLVSWPARLSGIRISTPFGGVDLMPTLVEWAGRPVPGGIDGRSVAQDLLETREPSTEPLFAEIATQDVIYRGEEDRDLFAGHVMMLDDNWKYVWNRFDTDELYDLSSDPSELKNLAPLADHASLVAEMRDRIGEMVSRTGPGPYAWCTEGT